MSGYDEMEAKADEFERTLAEMRETIRQGELHLIATRFAIEQGRARERVAASGLNRPDARVAVDARLATRAFDRVMERLRA